MATIAWRFALFGGLLFCQTGVLRADNSPPNSFIALLAGQQPPPSPAPPGTAVGQPCVAAGQCVAPQPGITPSELAAQRWVAQQPIAASASPAPSGMPCGQPFVPPGQYGLLQPAFTPVNFVASPSVAQQSISSPPATALGAPGAQSSIPPAQYGLPQPAVASENVAAPQPLNGTFRDEGQFVVIEVNGQELRLAKSALGQQPEVRAVGRSQVAVGSVHGRLLQHGRPLVGCNVVIVPMHADGATDDNGIRHPLSATTDSDGIYAFVNVPIGPYKLTWLPARTTQWIRRIEMKPDVFVREGQDTTLKDIGRACRQ